LSKTADYSEIDNFVAGLSYELSSLDGADSLLAGLENDMKQSIGQIKNSDQKTKRKLCAAIDDSYYTDILAQDDSFHVRTIALCNPVTSAAVLKKVAEDSLKDKFTLMIIAHNPNASLETLNQIFTYGGDVAEIREAVLNNPNCNDVLRFKIQDWANRRIDEL
jgi:hypothetical protein